VGRKEVEECLNKLRKVSRGDYVLTRDINDVNDCIKEIAKWMVEHLMNYGIDPEFVYELDPYIYKLRYVSSGDIIEPEDHNTIVDTLRKMRDVMERVEAETYSKGYNDGYSQGYSEGFSTGIREAYGYFFVKKENIVSREYSTSYFLRPAIKSESTTSTGVYANIGISRDYTTGYEVSKG